MEINALICGSLKEKRQIVLRNTFFSITLRHYNYQPMKKTTFWMLLTLFVTVGSYAQEKKYSVYGIGFYNLENLFDTCHDEGHNDY